MLTIPRRPIYHRKSVIGSSVLVLSFMTSYALLLSFVPRVNEQAPLASNITSRSDAPTSQQTESSKKSTTDSSGSTSQNATSWVNTQPWESTTPTIGATLQPETSGPDSGDVATEVPSTPAVPSQPSVPPASDTPNTSVVDPIVDPVVDVLGQTIELDLATP